MRNGNPNQPANPYATTRYGQAQPGQVNNPASYSRQVTAGQTQHQPNTYGYGGGTNTTGATRGGGVVMPPAPLTPTPVAPTPAPVNPLANMWWLPQNQPQGNTGQAFTVNGVTYNPGGLSNYQGVYTPADPRAVYEQANGPVSDQWWQMHLAGASPTFNGQLGYPQQQQSSFQLPNMNGNNPFAQISERWGY